MSISVERVATSSADAADSATMEYRGPLITRLRRFLATATNPNNNEDKYKVDDRWEDRSIKLDNKDKDKEDLSALDAAPVFTSNVVAKEENNNSATATSSLLDAVVPTDTVKNEKEQEATTVCTSLSDSDNDALTKNVALSATDHKATANLTLVTEPKAAVNKRLRTANSDNLKVEIDKPSWVNADESAKELKLSANQEQEETI